MLYVVQAKKSNIYFISVSVASNAGNTTILPMPPVASLVGERGAQKNRNFMHPSIAMSMDFESSKNNVRRVT